jgi:hypothetical protein
MVFRDLSDSQQKAIRFLKLQLADGAVREVRQIQLDARSQKIFPRTLTSARKLLGVKVTREGGQTAAFCWSLPAN